MEYLIPHCQVRGVFPAPPGIGSVRDQKLRGERHEIEVNVVRIFVADDNAMIRAHLRATLEEHAEWVVVGEAENGRRAVEACLKQMPNLTVMDLFMPVMDGL